MLHSKLPSADYSKQLVHFCLLSCFWKEFSHSHHVAYQANANFIYVPVWFVNHSVSHLLKSMRMTSRNGTIIFRTRQTLRNICVPNVIWKTKIRVSIPRRMFVQHGTLITWLMFARDRVCVLLHWWAVKLTLSITLLSLKLSCSTPEPDKHYSDFTR